MAATLFQKAKVIQRLCLRAVLDRAAAEYDALQRGIDYMQDQDLDGTVRDSQLQRMVTRAQAAEADLETAARALAACYQPGWEPTAEEIVEAEHKVA